MTTRRYPRSMAEAFKGPAYSCAIERPRKSRPVLRWIVASVVSVLAFTLISGAR